MDVSEIEENLFAVSDAKLHGGMCKTFSAIYCRVAGIFPVLEAARPRSKSGIQALCSLHMALEKAKSILQHCSECSKLYLAITGDSVVSKFDKARCALADSLRQVEDIVPQAIGDQILEIISELEETVLSLDLSERQIGAEIIAMLQHEQKIDDCNENKELESFHKAALKLGITSSKAALTERRALKKLIERARAEGDKRKESIVAFLLHLMRKYSKLFRNEFFDDNDSQGSSAPCSPTVMTSFESSGESGSDCPAYMRQFSNFNSFNFKPSHRRSGHVPRPPEELRCPISLQLMYDPVIISSGQTYERICIEKWFSDGHNTCPKTQQQLSHLCLTPNYSVKSLIANWCEQNGVPIPDSSPESLESNYWRFPSSETESMNVKSLESIASCNLKGIKVVPLEESGNIEEAADVEVKKVAAQDDELELNWLERYRDFVTILGGEQDLIEKCKVVENVRHLLKDDEEARIFLGAHGFVEALVRFLESALLERNEMAQGIGSMALFNLAVNNNRNKEMMLGAGVLSLLEEMISYSNSHGSTTALYLNLSCLEKAKPLIGLTQAVPFLVKVLQTETEPQCKLDALHALYNLSTHPYNIAGLLSAGIIQGLQSLFTVAGDDQMWTEKSIAVMINLASSTSGRDEMITSPGVISGLSSILDTGEAIEQEQAASCLLILCNGNEKCSQMVLQEGVIPALVSISVNGTMRGKDKAQKLLMLFREQRHQDPPSIVLHQASSGHFKDDMLAPEPKAFSKSVSRRRMEKAWSLLWKNKNNSTY